MGVKVLPDVLTWHPQVAVLNERYAWYVHLVSDYFVQLLRRTRRTEPDLANEVSELCRRVSGSGFLSAITAPESAFRILSQPEDRLVEHASFMHQALLAERMREGELAPRWRTLWTALGDTSFIQDGSRSQTHLAGDVPIDFGSPHFKKLDLDGEERDHNDGSIRYYEGGEVTDLVDRLNLAMTSIKRCSPYVYCFVTAFTKVILLGAVPDEAKFMSGSNSGWPGRVMILNGDLPGVTNEVLVDALVHESIHGLLTIEELHSRWSKNQDLLSMETVASPWSGRVLPLGAYLQACFVWYGLANFWLQAIGKGEFDEERALETLKLARRGFEHVRLTALLQATWRDALEPELLVVIDEMQERVLAGLPRGAGA